MVQHQIAQFLFVGGGDSAQAAEGEQAGKQECGKTGHGFRLLER